MTLHRSPNGSVRAAARFVLTVAVLLALGWIMLDVVEILGGAEGIHSRFGYASLALLLPMFAAPAIPGELVGLITVSIYGFTLGAPLVWLGLILRALIEYGLSSRLRGDQIEAAAMTGLPRWLDRFPAHHPVFLVAGRWMPLGNHIVSIVAGLRGVPLWRFAWTSALGLAPFALLVSAATSGLVAAHD